MNNFHSLISNFHTNLFGEKISKKIVVIESDDWGSIRMPNMKVFNQLKRAGIAVENSHYCKYDTLENEEDILLLLEVLSSVRNREGVNPVMTTNFVSTNPDFQKIKNSDLKKYYSQPIIETYKGISGHEKVLDIFYEGLKGGLVMPQFHGRDHVNVPLWLELLQSNKDFRLAFDLGMWGLSRDVFPQINKSIQATYDSTNLSYTKDSIIQGLEIFEKQFAFKSKSFIANNFVWANELNEVLRNHGVLHFQTMKYQLLPNDKNVTKKMIRRTFGSKNDLGQTYAPRNCAFEPTEFRHDHLYTLKQISSAFFYKKPAIISTHRINFVGGLDKRNRDQNLAELNRLLKKIIKQWPDVEFLSSDQLHDYIQRPNT